MPRVSRPRPAELKAILQEFVDRDPSLRMDSAFVAWWLRVYTVDDDEAARASLTGGAGDQNIDAIHISDAAKRITVVQGKCRLNGSNKAESGDSVLAFALLSKTLSLADDGEFRAATEGMDKATLVRAKKVRECHLHRGYSLHLQFVTTARVAPQLATRAKRLAGNKVPLRTLEVFSGDSVLHWSREWLDGVAPPVPEVRLPFERGSGVAVDGPLHRVDKQQGIASWVFSMRGDAIATLVEAHSPRIFARNVRGFLGGTASANAAMERTLEDRAAFFYYFNNGIAIVCDGADREPTDDGRYCLRVSNPQIINGQQTSRVLAEVGKHASQASVLVKVIEVPRGEGESPDQFDELISQIVHATNQQSAVTQADLMANDRRQVVLERELRRMRYCYIRKRMSKSEAKSLFGKSYLRFLKKEDLAQAVAACSLDPVILRSGKDHLFTQEYYEDIFPSGEDVEYFLSRYWFIQQVTVASKRSPIYAYLKWTVARFFWPILEKHLQTTAARRAFRQLLESRDQRLERPLRRALGAAFMACKQYYFANRGVGVKQQDPSGFFRSKKGRHGELAKFWGSKRNSHRGKLGPALTAVRRAINDRAES